MEGQSYVDENSKCGACGLDLGRQEVWYLVFSDDPPDLVAQVNAGTINYVRCSKCNFEGGWLWPPMFLFVDVARNRAVCVAFFRHAGQELGLLRQALRSKKIRSRGLDPDRLLKHTKIVHDYREIANASTTPIEQIEHENKAILEYLKREELHGALRVEQLVKSAIETGAIILEGEEAEPQFLTEVRKYRAGLTGKEDPRVLQTLEQVETFLGAMLVGLRKSLPEQDEMRGLAEILNSTSNVAAMAQKEFESHVEAANAETLQLRLAHLCDHNSHGSLQSDIAATIDLQPELLGLLEALLRNTGSETRILPENDRSMLFEVRTFLHSIPAGIKTGLSEPKPKVVLGPTPQWVERGYEVLEEMYSAVKTGGIPIELLDRLSDVPAAQAFVHAELENSLTEQGALSLAIHHLQIALELLEGLRKADERGFDESIARLYAVCLERLGRVHLRYGRLEDAIGALHAARAMYEEIGARDGVLSIVIEEGSICLDLGQLERAEELFGTAAQSSQGSATPQEFRDLMNLANVYRRLNPWADADLRYSIADSDSATRPDVSPQIAESIRDAFEKEAFEKKGGMRVSVRVDGHDELAIRMIAGSEQLRLLYRALTVAMLNQDAGFERKAMARLVAVYGEQGCEDLANFILGRLLKNLSLEDAGIDAQLYVWNRLGQLTESFEQSGNHERAAATRMEQLQLIEHMMAQGELPVLVLDEVRGDKACLLEGLDQAEDARRAYRAIIERLERSRSWMRDPENKKGLQSRRWRPYVRSARNSLRMYSKDRSRRYLLIEAWHDIEAGRSRAMLDAIAAEQTGELKSEGVVSVYPAEFAEISARLAKDLAILEFALLPSSPGCPGSWVLFVVEPGANEPWLALQEPDMDRFLGAQKRLAEVADDYEKTVLENRAVAGDLEHTYMSALDTLADILFPERLLDELRSRGYRRLVIVPDAYLHDVPFAALRPIQAGERAYLGLPNDRTGFQIVNAPSSSIFAHWVQRDSERTATRRSAALFVDPLGDLSNGKPAVTQTFAAIRARLLERQFEVKRFDGKDATPNAWLNEARECDLVVYFGHSIAGPEHAEQAALRLNDGSGREAPVTADGIYRAATQRLFSGHSVFLFASCSSGFVSAGTWDSDRELRGLSAAHLYAGCGAVIAASRPLLDLPTLVLLDAILAKMLSGVDAASSLSKAQSKLAASQSPYSHPHFWGYVVFMGSLDLRFAA
jgi:tetratricopeptide (TPR) repeat protein